MCCAVLIVSLLLSCRDNGPEEELPPAELWGELGALTELRLGHWPGLVRLPEELLCRPKLQVGGRDGQGRGWLLWKGGIGGRCSLVT